MFRVCALPLLVEDGGEPLGVGRYSEGMSVFGSDRDAYEYLVRLARRDLQYRGFRDERVICFEYKSEANFLLYRRVRAALDEHEYRMLRQSWDGVNRPKYAAKRWSDAQEEVLKVAEAAVSHDDEETLQKSYRWLYVQGPPGSGKSAILLEVAIRMAYKGLRVLIVCPTGTNVYSFKSQLPDFDGVDRIGVDTIQGVLAYKRLGADSKVCWAQQTALRRIDVLLCDEASQYIDEDWGRFSCQ